MLDSDTPIKTIRSFLETVYNVGVSEKISFKNFTDEEIVDLANNLREEYQWLLQFLMVLMKTR